MVREAKSEIIIWAGHVVSVGERRNAFRVLMSNTEGKAFLEDLNLDGKIILKLVLSKYD
jgi:hypothetical protein